VLSPGAPADSRVALNVRLVGGLSRRVEIARAFLVPEPTIAQRLVRAKARDPRARPRLRGPRG